VDAETVAGAGAAPEAGAEAVEAVGGPPNAAPIHGSPALYLLACSWNVMIVSPLLSSLFFLLPPFLSSLGLLSICGLEPPSGAPRRRGRLTGVGCCYIGPGWKGVSDSFDDFGLHHLASSFSLGC